VPASQAQLPLVSVITPVFNGSDHIAACMQSVFHALTCGSIRIEHIIIDDGSSDTTLLTIQRTLGAFKALPKHTYKCRVLPINHTGKPSRVRNHGIYAAQGDWIFCLDHDDILLQNTLRHLVQSLEEKQVQVVYGDFLRADATLSYLVGDDYYGWPHKDAYAALNSIFRGEHFYQHSLMFSKKLWEKVGGYDEWLTFGEDLDLCTRMILAGHMPIHLPITTHIHRNHKKSLTACYSNPQIWLAEKQAHFQKYLHILPYHLNSEDLESIRRLMKITPGSSHEPLNRAEALALLA
jgi:glycosyltransferase involved in cell wall biosynthesis